MTAEDEAMARAITADKRPDDLVVVPKAQVLHRLEPLPRRYVTHFLRCRDCDRLYWHGSHLPRMRELVANLHRQPRGPLSSR